MYSRPVPGYEEFYNIDELGVVMRTAKARGTKPGKIIKQHADKKGYMRIRLTDGQKASTLKVHRLVALAFIPNPNNFPEINHIDLVKSNNYYKNLEWCTGLYNMQHAAENDHVGKCWLGKKGKEHNKSIPILAIKISTGEERSFAGGWEAARELGLRQGSIANVIRGRVKSTGGWKFSKMNNLQTVRVEENKEGVSQ